MTRLARLPGRVRLALALAGLVAVLLGATGVFVDLRLGDELDATIEQGLTTRAADLTALVRRRYPVPAGDEELFAQVGGAILTPDERRRARQGTIIVRHQGREDPLRLLATPVDGTPSRHSCPAHRAVPTRRPGGRWGFTRTPSRARRTGTSQACERRDASAARDGVDVGAGADRKNSVMTGTT